MKTLKYSILALALVAGTSTLAHANGLNASPAKSHPHPIGSTAPEVDPGMAISGLTLLGGALTVLRMKRRKQ